jgi:hypothetical protein
LATIVSQGTRTIFRARLLSSALPLPIALFLSQSHSTCKCIFKSANLQVQFTAAIYKLRSTTGEMPALDFIKVRLDVRIIVMSGEMAVAIPSRFLNVMLLTCVQNLDDVHN